MEKKKETNQRGYRAKLNIVVALVAQVVTLLCGFIVPGLLIRTYGSETYGATTSIAQFLAYITLLEGGVGGVARSALYKPLANKNTKEISEILNEVKHFFRMIAYVYVVYVIILAVCYHKLSNIQCMDQISTMFLVFAISISTFAQYFLGFSYMVLIQADQKVYITNIINVSTTVLNTVVIAALVFCGFNIIVVKLISSFVFTLRPVLMYGYVRRRYKIESGKKRNKNALSQKWTALGQHIAFFLHSNTDIAVLTIISSLSAVAVYSVYNMIVSSIQNITASFSAGMEALFGDMLAKKEYEGLQRTFSLYETLISFFTILLFGVTAVMIVPFIAIYTRGVSDVNYIEPTFAVLLIIASMIYCLRLPYHAVVIAAGRFEETKFAAYGEAILNLSISIILVYKLGLIGVAIGTVSATMFRMLFYAFYLSKNIIYRSFSLYLKREFVNAFVFIVVFVIGNLILKDRMITSYILWGINAVFITIISFIIVLFFTAVFYHQDLKLLIKKFLKKGKEK